jgi:hypothetical protein
MSNIPLHVKANLSPKFMAALFRNSVLTAQCYEAVYVARKKRCVV